MGELRRPVARNLRISSSSDRVERSLPCGLAFFVLVRLVSGFEKRLAVSGRAGLDLASALNLGIQLSTEQDHRIGDPQPHEEDDNATQGTIGLVVRGKARNVEGKSG